jgi:diguanylate cyclase (GGDEF)-like protein
MDRVHDQTGVAGRRPKTQPSRQLAEITRLRSEVVRLRRLAATDPLTGVGNRGAFRARFRQVARGGTSPLSVLLIDVDHFKAFNDRYGHQTGDRVLRRVARVLQGSLRRCDFLARYGGEEFIVILPSTGRAASREIAERLRRAVADGPWPHAPVTVSIGVATLTGGSPRIQELVRAADRALYEAKAGGRNRVSVHRPARPHRRKSGVRGRGRGVTRPTSPRAKSHRGP